MASHTDRCEATTNTVLVTGLSARTCPVSFLDKLLDRKVDSTMHTNFDLETKYYKAVVTFETCSTFELLDARTSETSSQAAPTALIVLCHGNEDVNSFLQDIEPILSRQLLSDVGTFLLVQCGGKCLSGTDEQQLLEWCMSHSCEFIDAEAQPPKDHAEDENTPFREKFGFSRVLEALEVTSWPEMTMQPRRGARSTKPSWCDDLSCPLSATVASDHKGTEPHDLSVKQAESRANEADEADVDLAGLQEDAHFAQFSSFLSSLVESLTVDENAPQKMASGLGLDADSMEDPELKQAEQFEGAIHSLRTLREKASTMPDEDRRAFAASVSLAFAQLLVHDDEEEKEEEGEENSDEKE